MLPFSILSITDLRKAAPTSNFGYKTEDEDGVGGNDF